MSWDEIIPAGAVGIFAHNATPLWKDEYALISTHMRPA